MSAALCPFPIYASDSVCSPYLWDSQTPVRFTDPVDLLELEQHAEIPKKQIELAARTLDQKRLQETLFIIPRNDGEALRAVQILEAAKAPHLKVSSQTWGATLDRENLSDLMKGATFKKIAVFEIPDPATEAKLKEMGFEVILFDHHFYAASDRRNDKSSLEQLIEYIRWPASRTDEAIAVNDRGYIPGLKAMDLSDDEIRSVRAYDLMAQGKDERSIEKEIKRVRALIPSLPSRNGYTVAENLPVDSGILKQELSIQSPSGIASVLEIGGGKLGFSGSPKIAQFLLDLDFTQLGYPRGAYKQYGGGDPNASMFFGFKPEKGPLGKSELLPQSVIQQIERMLSELDSTGKNKMKVSSQGTTRTEAVRKAKMLPRGSALATTSGNLSSQGITQIIHAASGSMSRSDTDFKPSFEGVTLSVKNAIALARENKHRRIAIPFIGGKIFVERIGIPASELAQGIVDTALENAGGLEIRFVTFGDEDTQLFQNALKRSRFQADAKVLSGSITDFSLHGASAIVNAANMEVVFGGGLSGAIARATGKSDAIDAEAQKLIQEFYGQP